MELDEVPERAIAPSLGRRETTMTDARKQLDELLGDDQFIIQEKDGELMWCIVGTTCDNLGWETDDYEAVSISEAIEDAIEYLVARQEKADEPVEHCHFCGNAATRTFDDVSVCGDPNCLRQLG